MSDRETIDMTYSERVRRRRLGDHEPVLPRWCAGRWRPNVPCDSCGVLTRELEDHTLEHVTDDES